MWWWWLVVVEKGEAAVKVAAAAAAIERAVRLRVLDVFGCHRLALDAPSNRAPPPSPRNYRRVVKKSAYCHPGATGIQSVYVPQFPPSFQLTLMVTSHFSLVAEHRTCKSFSL